MNEQIVPSQELVNKIINSINESPQKTKKAKQTWFKPALKFALPALLVLTIVCIQIIQTNVSQVINAPITSDNVVSSEANAAAIPKSNNWFSLVAYAVDNKSDEVIQIELQKDIKVVLPALRMITYGPMPMDNKEVTIAYIYSYYDTSGFKIEGENIKSVIFKSKYGGMRTIPIDFEHHSDSDYEFESYEAMVEFRRTVIMESDDIFDLMVTWWAEDYQAAVCLGEDSQKYLTDTITITVTFDDDEQITQIVEMTIDEETGEIFAQIVN